MQQRLFINGVIFMRKTAEILGIHVDYITMQEAMDKLNSFLDEDRVHAIYTPNSEILMEGYKDPSLKDILNRADLLIADGAGVVLASRILGINLPEKVSGVDLTRNSFSMERSRKIRYFIFGGKPGVAEAAAKNILEKYPQVEIAGYRNGYFSPEDEPDIINSINSSNADILLVALGAPRQENWIHKHKSSLNVKVCIGVGGSIDIFAGTAKLAPEFIRKNGFEWLYRLCQEPWRYKRMLKLPQFIFTVLLKKLRIK